MNLRDQLIRDEGLRLKPYRDTVGKLTIGVGRNLDDNGITRDEAECLLHNDLARVYAELHHALPDLSLDPVRGAVLGNMAFNMGIGRLLGFRKMLAALRVGDFAQAAVEMLDSDWATQVGSRAHRLARQMETGEWV